MSEILANVSVDGDGEIAVWVVAIGFGLVFLQLASIIIRSRKRRNTIKNLANELGFAYSKYEKNLPESFESFTIFLTGRLPSISNCIRGTFDDFMVTVVDYKYSSVEGGSKSKTHRQTITMISLEEKNIPAFEILPETIFQKIKTAIGSQDIDFGSHPEFSKKYVVKGTKEDSIRESLSDRFLTSIEKHKGLSIECNGTNIIFYRRHELLSPEEIKPFIHWGIRRINELKS